MADNIIKVTVSSSAKKNVTVSSANVGTEITASSDTGKFWAQTSKNWAVSDNIVDNTDYSSKYYANKAKESANIAQSNAGVCSNIYNSVQEVSQTVFQNIDIKSQEAVTNINNAKTEAVDSINSTKSTAISDIEFVADGEKQEIEELIDSGKDELKEAIGDVKVLTTLKIGQIGIAPLGIDETLNMERYLNGQIIIQDQFKGFTKFLKRRIELYPSVACTEEEWQTEVTMSAFSQCGKFVIDDNAGTIRLPKVVNIQGLTDLSKLAEIVEAGLPNIEGSLSCSRLNQGDPDKQYASGAFSWTTTSKMEASGSSNANTGQGFNFDASLSNPIYGNSNTVQQEQIQYPYFIQVATGAETEDNIINEIELNNPYSFGDSKYSPVALNNLSWLKSEGQYNSKAVYPAYYDWALTNFNNGVEGFALSTGEYTDYDVVINTADETFRLPLLDGSEDLPSDRYESLTLLSSQSTYTTPANGWFNLDKTITSGGQGITITNTTSNQAVQSSAHANGNSVVCEMFAKKGDVIKVSYDAGGSTNFFRFIYAQGNGSLYYYVGETVQNVNLINAGRIEEKVADLIPNNSDLITGYCCPDWDNAISFYYSTTTFTAPQNGYFVLVTSPLNSNGGVELRIYINGVQVVYTNTQVASWNRFSTCFIPVSKGDVITQNDNTNPGPDFLFVPMKGAK